jgi:dTDP-4-amino-4,6-dideoxygalactose transaminase
MKNYNHNQVSVKKIKDIIIEVYKNRYFTNHGPLAQKFEKEFEIYLNVSNAISVMNNTLALLIAICGSNDGKTVSVLNGCDKDVLDAATMANIRFEIISIDTLLNDSVEGITQLIFSENMLSKDNLVFFKKLETKGTKFIICNSFLEDVNYNNYFKNSISVYSLGSGSLVQGGIITTDDSKIAEIFRNIRSSYGTREVLKVKATCNGRFSEVQAGIGLELLKSKVNVFS